MRGTLTLGRRIPIPIQIQSQSIPFSTFSGRGRGRGGATTTTNDEFSRAPGKPDSDDSPSSHSPHPPPGLGHGRGKPIASSSFLPSFSAFDPTPPPPESSSSSSSGPKKPIFFRKDELPPKEEKPESGNLPSSILSVLSDASGGKGGKPETNNLPSSILAVLSGAGRGKPQQQQNQPIPKPPQQNEENRHLRARPTQPPNIRGRGFDNQVGGTPTPRLSREEAVKKAVEILSRGEEGGGEGIERGGRGRGGRGFSGGRGRGRGLGRGGRGRGRDRYEDKDGDDGYGSGLYLGDNADGEKLANKIGPDHMKQLVDAFEEMSGRVLPSPMEDAYLDALHTNCLIEFEPEYSMEEFGTNPDIDDKPPIPLRDALEKMKPFLMAYEGIQSQEEWEEVMKETMEKVPYLKELVDYYSGPDRVTAKQQQQELERVANTLPASAPASVTRFANRAVLSLQSNPGWGFDKKCQFMDKLAWEVSQQYK